MSLSYFTYPEKGGAIDSYGIVNYGGILWFEDTGNAQTIANPYGTQFTLNLNAGSASDPFQEFPLFYFSNGCYISIKYRLYKDMAPGGVYDVYHLASSVLFYDKDGNMLYENALLSADTPYVLTDIIPPFSNWWFIPGLTSYETNHPTQTGEEAAFFAFGAFYCQNGSKLIPSPINKVEKEPVYRQTWNRYLWWTAYNDATYDQFKDRLIEAGDGSDPTEKDDGSGGYDPSKPSEPGGGDKPTYGPGDGDPIPFPTLPTVSALSTGLLSAYKMDSTKLAQLAAELWSTDFFDSISKILNDPFDAIIGLSIIPYDVTGVNNLIKIGNYETEVYADKVSAQFIKVSGGSFTVPLTWGNFLDYTHTTLSLYLPFVGIKRIDPDDVLDKLVTIEYNIDILSGSGICSVMCDNSVIYSYPCNINYDVPLTGSNKASLYTGLINTAMSAVTGAVAAGGVGAVMGAASGSLSTATSKQSDVSRSGSLSGNTGVLGEFNAYIIIHRPTQSLPADFKAIKGYKSNITKQLEQCKGFTKVDAIHLSVPGANSAELEEIERLLKEGVLI